MTILYYTFFHECAEVAVFAQKLHLLPEAQAEKVRKFRRWEDAHASLLGKLLLLRGFAAFGIRSGLQDLKCTAYGKPYIESSAVSFNISHSGNCVVCVLSDESGEIGVDVEEVKPIDVNDFRYIWNEAEWDKIRSGDIQLFYEYWTSKEAVMKAEGRGFSIPLQAITIAEQHGECENKMYFFNRSSLLPNYIMNVASATRIDHLEMVAVGQEELL